MTGFVSPLQGVANRGPEMPTTLWLIAAGMWLAAVGATCALLTVTKRGPRRQGPPDDDAAGLVEPGIEALTIDAREPGVASATSATSAIAPGGPDRRRPQRGRGALPSINRRGTAMRC